MGFVGMRKLAVFLAAVLVGALIAGCEQPAGLMGPDAPEEKAAEAEKEAAVKPAAVPGAGEVDSGTEITLSTATEGADIYYTLDGSAPDTSKTKYTGPVSITNAVTVKAVAVKAGMTVSGVLEAVYTVTALGAVAKPTANPAAGEVDYGTTVTLSTTTEGASIYYTTNGTAADKSKRKYTGPVSVTGNPDSTFTIRAIAVKAGMADSAELEAAYTIKMEPEPGTIDEDVPPVITGITILSPPDITLYAKNQRFDKTGLVVAWVYSNGSVEPTGAYQIDEPDMSLAVTKRVYVRAGSYRTSFWIQVLNTDKALTRISVEGPSNTTQYLGKDFDKTGLVVTGYYSDGSTSDLTSIAGIYGYDKSMRGPQAASVRVNGKIAPLAGIVTRIGDDAKVSINAPSWTNLTNNERNAYRSVYIKGEAIRPEICNIRLTVNPGGGAGVVPLSYASGNITREELAGITGYNPNQAGNQTAKFTLDGRVFNLNVIVIDTEPEVWFDYGYMRHEEDPEGAGKGAKITEGKYYAKPGETVILAPVRYLVGYNADHSDAGASYTWTVSGGPYTTTGNGEFLRFIPSAAGTYNIGVSVTGKSYVTGANVTKTASTQVVCFDDSPPGVAIKLSLNNFAPGQFTEGGTGYGWSLGVAGGYTVWSVEHRSTYMIKGNSFAGWLEAGIVWVQEDRNGNGLPDETWYELKGGDDDDPTYRNKITRRYAVRFFGASDGGSTVNKYGHVLRKIYWTDSKGRGGYLPAGWPYDWGVTGNWVTYTCTLLRDDGNIDTGTYGHYPMYGYVDAMGNTFSIKDAIDIAGNPVSLQAVRFVKVQTAIFHYGGMYGDVSTEIRSGDFLGKTTDFPMPEGSY
jgi:hypothetical protein